jgi:fructose-bisphosphate aldolase class II
MDHAHSYDGILRAVRWGFTSVMFDGSKLPFEENLKRTKEICSMAHALGISVEGELGYRSKEEMVDVAQLATVDMAAEFVAKTHVDALAIAFRNREGGQINTDKLEELA